MASTGWAKRIGRIALVLATIVGVPVLVVLFTGGQSSVIYWIDVAMFSLFAYTIGFWPLWVLLVVPLGLVTWVVGKFSTVAAERIGRYFTPVIWILGGTNAFLVMGPTPGEGVALPTGLPRVGALLVMLGASLLSAGLLIVVRRIQMPTQDLAPIPISRSLTPLPWHAMPEVEEPTEEFWSPEAMVGWRALAMDRLGACGASSASGPPSASSPGATTARSRRDGTTLADLRRVPAQRGGLDVPRQARRCGSGRAVRPRDRTRERLPRLPTPGSSTCGRSRRSSPTGSPSSIRT